MSRFSSVTPVWFFDLDNTLHDATPEIFPHINASMTRYVETTLQVSQAEANRLRQDYWQRYGATLLGLLRHHAIDANHFLHHTHQFDNLGALIRSERGLRELLKRLPGRKVLLTNAPHAYAQQVLQHLGLHGQFARHYAVEHMRVFGHYRPKPSRTMLRILLRRERVAAHRAILVEDSLENLRSAHRCGMRTVWVTQHERRRMLQERQPMQQRQQNKKTVACNATACKNRPHFVNLKVESVRKLVRTYPRLMSY